MQGERAGEAKLATNMASGGSVKDATYPAIHCGPDFRVPHIQSDAGTWQQIQHTAAGWPASLCHHAFRCECEYEKAT